MTPDHATVAARATRILAGDRRAMAALMRDLDDDRADARDVLRVLQAGGADAAASGSPVAQTRSIVVGVTGGPGAGKSTLVDALIAAWRAGGETVGVVAIDPSSPLAGGAVLGDRIRMQRHATDTGVFIRSVASRGALGGLSRSAMNVVAVLVAGGFSRVLVETVGAGQAEVDIAAAADLTLVVLTPGLGDDVQMLKAGILEIADILVLNKADRPGADAAVRDLQAMLGLRQAVAAPGPPNSPKPAESEGVSIVQTVATTGVGVPALVAAIDLAWASATATAPVAASERRHRRAEARIRAAVTARFEAAVRQSLATGGPSASLVDDVAGLRLDIDAAADALMARLRGGY
ncbi:MAG: methylmalonyl Co-A mutase-associated GTPase MeaB [Deltaproteobacteria bacterium]|nr:methylmalonyl Co-A mutase-associated GTPase MeaB [Deltaproteobacteria bacterium]